MCRLRHGSRSHRPPLDKRNSENKWPTAKPTGLGPPAQGWRVIPTLGAGLEIEPTPTALWLKSGARAGTDGPQPRCGWGCLSDDDPRVARASQPWAPGRNPVGILERSATLRVAAGSPARRWLDVSAATLHAEVLRFADMLNDGRARIPKSREGRPKVAHGFNQVSTVGCDWRMARAAAGRQKRWDWASAFFRP